MTVKFIEEKPSFNDMADFREDAKQIVQAVVSLAEGQDVSNRASDLYELTKSLYESACAMLLNGLDN